MLTATPLARALLLMAALLLALPVAGGLALLDEPRRERILGRGLAPWPWAEPGLDAPRGLTQALADRALGVAASARTLAWIRYETLGDDGVVPVVRNAPLAFVTDHNLLGRRDFNAIAASCTPDLPGAVWPAALRHRAARIAESAGAPGRAVVFLAVPSKPVLYADRLPPSVPPHLRRGCRAADARWAEAWAGDAEQRGYAVTYPLAGFRAARDGAHFYPPENFHADGAGADLAARAALRALYPDEPWPEPRYAPRPGRADMRPFYLYDRQITLLKRADGPTPRRAHAIEARVAAEFPELPPVRAWRMREAPTRRAVVIGNSFVLRIAPHLARGYGELILVEGNRLAPETTAAVFDRLIPAIDPDAVVLVYHDAALKTRGLGRLIEGLSARPSDPE